MSHIVHISITIIPRIFNSQSSSVGDRIIRYVGNVMTIQIKCHGSSRRDHYILFQILLKHDRHITRHIIQCVCNIHIRIVANFHRTVICLNSRILCCVFCLNSRILCCACCLYTELCTFFCVLSFF